MAAGRKVHLSAARRGRRQAIAALGAEVPPLQRDEYTLEQLLDEVVGPSPQLMAIAVHKHRVHYMVDGCMIELTEVRTDCGTATTIAAESEDPTRVVATVRALGLERSPTSACRASSRLSRGSTRTASPSSTWERTR